jgi:hypothetical protein
MNYKEQPISGRKWRRSHRVEINNPLGSTNKTITFHELEHVELADGEVTGRMIGAITEPFLDPTAEFQIVNPMDDSPIEGFTSTYMDVYVLLHSLYLHLAKRRDQAEA